MKSLQEIMVDMKEYFINHLKHEVIENIKNEDELEDFMDNYYWDYLNELVDDYTPHNYYEIIEHFNNNAFDIRKFYELSINEKGRIEDNNIFNHITQGINMMLYDYLYQIDTEEIKEELYNNIPCVKLKKELENKLKEDLNKKEKKKIKI